MKLLFALALALAAPAAAGAATQPPALRFVADSQSGFASLGPSSGFYDVSDREMRIVSPADPRGVPVAIPVGCEGAGVSLPHRLLACDERTSYRLLDTRTGTVANVDASACVVDEREAIRLDELGRHWIGGTVTTPYQTNHGVPSDVPVFLNRSTGTCRRFRDADDGWRDVDRPSLPKRHAPRCSDRGRRRLLRGTREHLDLVFCDGKRRRIRLARSGWKSAALGAHSVAWSTRTRVHVLLLRSGRRLSWRVTRYAGGRPIDLASPAYVRDRLYVSLDTPHRAPGEAADRILSVRLPRR